MRLAAALALENIDLQPGVAHDRLLLFAHAAVGIAIECCPTTTWHLCAKTVDPYFPLPQIQSRGAGQREICRSQEEQHVQQSDLSWNAHDRAFCSRWDNSALSNQCVHLVVAAGVFRR